MFRPVENEKFYMQIANQIRNRIEVGELKPGDKLPTESELEEAFKASRSSIREALSALEILGLIERKGRKGKFIRQKDPQQVNYMNLLKDLLKHNSPMDLFESRLELEPSIAALAAEKATPSEIEKLHSQLQRLETIESRATTKPELAEQYIDEYMEEDRNFHLLIGESAHNEVLFKFFSGVHITMKKFHWELLKRRVILDHETLREINQEHQKILKAIEFKKPESARNMMIRHIEHLREVLP